MQAGCLKKHVCHHPHCEADEKQGSSSHFEWQPEDEYKIEIRYNELVQWWDLVQHKNLDEHDQYKPDDIFKE